MDNKPLYAVIPAAVFYDTNLSANARLLFGELSGLASSQGFCWASNQYFQSRHNVSRRSITKWIGELSDAGYIDVKCFLDENQIQRRHIYITEAGLGVEANCMGGGKNVHGGGEEKFHAPVKKSATLIVKNNNKSNTKSIRAKRPTVDEVQAYCNERANGIDAQYFCDYYGARGWKTKGGNPVQDWQACVRTWERGDQQRNQAKKTDSIKASSIEDKINDRSWAL